MFYTGTIVSLLAGHLPGASFTVMATTFLLAENDTLAWLCTQ